MKKAVISLAIVAIVGGGAIFGWNYAQSEAKKQVRQFVEDAKLEESFDFREVSYNPLSGTLVISDIEIFEKGLNELFQLEPGIASIEVLDFEKTGDFVTSLHAKVNGIRLNTLKSAKWSADQSRYRSFKISDDPKELLGNPLGALIALGYPKLLLNMEFKWEFDEDDQTITLETGMTGIDVGRLHYSVRLANVRSRMLREMARLNKDSEDKNFQRQIAEIQRFFSQNEEGLLRIGLSEVSVAYKDLGLVKRWFEFGDRYSYRLPGTPRTFLNPDDFRLDEKAIRDLRADGISPEIAKSASEALIDFIIDPDELNLSFTADEPVSIDLIQRATDGNGQFHFLKLGKLDIGT